MLRQHAGSSIRRCLIGPTRRSTRHRSAGRTSFAILRIQHHRHRTRMCKRGKMCGRRARSSLHASTPHHHTCACLKEGGRLIEIPSTLRGRATPTTHAAGGRQRLPPRMHLTHHAHAGQASRRDSFHSLWDTVRRAGAERLPPLQHPTTCTTGVNRAGVSIKAPSTVGGEVSFRQLLHPVRRAGVLARLPPLQHTPGTKYFHEGQASGGGVSYGQLLHPVRRAGVCQTPSIPAHAMHKSVYMRGGRL